LTKKANRRLSGGFGLLAGVHLASPQQTQTAINWFISQGFTVMGGVPTYWRTLQNDSCTNAAWTLVYLSFGVTIPWTVGRFGHNAGADIYTVNIAISDLAECKSKELIICPWFSLIQL
jgi:hypothetical protein